MYMLCTTTGIWRPRLLAKAWKGAEVRLPAYSHIWATHLPTPLTLTLTSAHLHFGRVCDTPEDRVMGMQSCRTEAG